MKVFRREPDLNCDRDSIQKIAIKILSKNKYKFTEEIGRGSFGDVLAVRSKRNRAILAAKVIYSNLTSPAELSLWPELNHRNIIPVLDIIRQKNVDIFLMPYHPYCLINILHEWHVGAARYKPEFFELTVGWLRDMFTGLDYLHRSGLCHLNLKIDNLLITSENIVVICDFSALDRANEPTNRYALPQYYCPPESWPEEIGGERPFVDGIAFDVWSAGMVVFYIFSNRWMERHLWGKTKWMDEIYPLVHKCLQMPFFRSQPKESYRCVKLTNKDYFQSLNLLQGLLRYKPEDRPTVHRILEHPVLAEVKGSGNVLEPDEIWVREKTEIYAEWKNTEFKLRLRNQVKNIMKKARDIVKEARKNEDDADNGKSMAPNASDVRDLESQSDSDEFRSQSRERLRKEKLPRVHKQRKVSKLFSWCRSFFSRRQNKSA